MISPTVLSTSDFAYKDNDYHSNSWQVWSASLYFVQGVDHKNGVSYTIIEGSGAGRFSLVLILLTFNCL